MTATRPPDRRGATLTKRLPVGTMALAGVLVLIPILALMLIPTYARKGPALFGFPFFYWYQLMWVLIAAGFTYGAYLVVTRARRTR